MTKPIAYQMELVHVEARGSHEVQLILQVNDEFPD